MSKLSVNILRYHVVRMCLLNLVRTSESPTFMTLTFQENVTDIRLAVRRFNFLFHGHAGGGTRGVCLLSEFPDLRMVGIWARQKRGAWHIHAVVNRFLPVAQVRQMCLYNGWGPFCNLEPVGRKAKPLPADAEKISKYIARYATGKNGLCPIKDKSVRRLIFIGKNVRIVNMRWRSSLKLIVQIGREFHAGLLSGESESEAHYSETTYLRHPTETWGERHKRLFPYWFNLGWAELDSVEQNEMLTVDRFTRDYLIAGKVSYV